MMLSLFLSNYVKSHFSHDSISLRLLIILCLCQNIHELNRNSLDPIILILSNSDTSILLSLCRVLPFYFVNSLLSSIPYFLILFQPQNSFLMLLSISKTPFFNYTLYYNNIISKLPYCSLCTFLFYQLLLFNLYLLFFIFLF